MAERDNSIYTYTTVCPATGKTHDWRHATDAPGWRIGDECVRCQACQQKAIDVKHSAPCHRPIDTTGPKA